MSEDKVKKLIHSIGLEFNLQDDIIKKIIQCPYKFTREKISELDLENISKEDFEKVKTNFIYVHIGKLYTNYQIYEKIQKQKFNLKQKWEKKE